MEDDFNASNYSDYGGGADLDLSFTSIASSSAATATTFASSARTSRSSTSLALSFNDRLSTASAAADQSPDEPPYPPRPHRRNDPHWSAVRAAANLSGDGRIHLRHLKLLRRLGAGDVGRVFLCRLRDFPSSSADAHFALKVVDRNSLSPKKLCHVDTEARILSALDHPFLPTLYAHITASHYTCLLIDYCPGGDLNNLLRCQPLSRLPLHAVRFYAAEVLVALEYLHSKGIVYRDLKPENILLREDGHIMLSDFDLCFTSDVTAKIDRCQKTRSKRRNYSCFGDKEQQSGSSEDELFVAEPTAAFSKSCVGTHEYLAPELLTGNGYGSGVDWWAFGVLIYELMYGTTPFKGANKEATLRNIASQSKSARFPADVPEEKGMAEVRDLIERLLVKDPRERLGGSRGAADVKRHLFFEAVKWPLIRGYRPPEIVKGVVAARRRRSRSHVMGHVSRRRSLWRRLSYLLKKRGSSSSSK